jgi:hypothetical protein
MSEQILRKLALAFLLAAPPLPVTHGVGTPINPYALK